MNDSFFMIRIYKISFKKNVILIVWYSPLLVIGIHLNAWQECIIFICYTFTVMTDSIYQVLKSFFT
jgi:hypothetical protein